MNTTHYGEGLLALRYLKSMAIGGGDNAAAIGYAEARADWGVDRASVVRQLKSALSGLSIGETTGGASDVRHDLLAALRPLTIVGRLPLRRQPPRMPFLTQTGPARAYWVGESKARRMTVGSYSRDGEGLITKTVAALTVATSEALEDKSIDAENALLADLLDACAEGLDRAFIDRLNTGSASTPASINSAVTPIPASGVSLDDLDADFAMAIRQLSDAGSNLRAAYWVMPSYFAARLALTRGIDGGPAYPGLGALGGQLAGLPVITSAAAEAEANSDDLADVTLLDASQISFAEEEPTLRTSTNAVIEMDTAPTGASDTPTAASATMVSMFQAECVALLAQMSVNWSVRREGMVQVISGMSSVIES
ncbi:phage major capsid protein [Piscinibacter sp.]|uniref:phage major capsid protein n=1 Tax=Piscinibacter sp. TaxID=1903157 RepID=UPI002BD43BBF|nr:phage major capsid protein [Albitalea sp.]HUG26216.1 phage major capsid protein [Albitalea sp.]